MNKKRKEKYSECYLKLYPLAVSILYAKLGSMNDAEDIAQEVFIKLYHKFDEIDNARRWIYRALQFELQNYVKKRNLTHVDIRLLLNDISFSYVNGFRDTRIIINTVLEDEKLYDNEEERIIFDMIALKGFSQKQVSKHLGLSRHRVRYQYNQTRDKILAVLQGRGIKNLEDLL